MYSTSPSSDIPTSTLPCSVMYDAIGFRPSEELVIQQSVYDGFVRMSPATSIPNRPAKSDDGEGVPRSAGVSEGLNENDLGRSLGRGQDPPSRSIPNSPSSYPPSSPSGGGRNISPKDGSLILISAPPCQRPPF